MSQSQRKELIRFLLEEVSLMSHEDLINFVTDRLGNEYELLDDKELFSRLGHQNV